MIQAARFTAAACLQSQRWLAPVLVYAIALAATFASGGDPLTNLSVAAACLFPVTAWLVVVSLNDEDDDHAVIIAAIVGGMRRLRLAKLVVAAVAGAALAVGSLAFAYARAASSFTSADLAAGLIADVVVAAGAIGVGALCARPFVSRAGTALMLICGATIVELLVPDAPLRLVLAGLGGSAPRWRILVAGVGMTFAVAIALTVLGLALSEQRSSRTES